MLMVLGKPFERWKCVYKSCRARCCRIDRELTPLDIRRISEETGKPYEDFVEVAPRKNKMPFLLKRTKGKCVFLGPDYKCELHRVKAKPLLCQMYPFLLSKVIYADELIMEISPVEDCPGYGKGPRFGKKAQRLLAANARVYLSELGNVASQRRRGMTPEGILKNLSGTP
jgi:Fe-S-cluster containining protein